MANETDVKSATVAAKQTAKTGGKASGVIVFNRNLDTWIAYNAAGQMAQTGSKAVLQATFPEFTTKE